MLRNDDLDKVARREISRRRIFSLHKSAVVAANGTHLLTFQITDMLRSFMIRSISLDYIIATEPVNGVVTIIDGGYRPACRLQVFFGNADQIHIPLDQGLMNIPMVAGTDFNATRFYMYNPGQKFFDSWYVREALPVRVDIWNDDPVNSYQVRYDLLIETELYPS